MGKLIYDDGSGGAKTVPANGTEQTEEITVQGDDKLYLFLESETGATNIDVQLQALWEADGTWHDVDGEVNTGVDVGESPNDAKVIGPFNVEGLEHKARFALMEQGGSGEDLIAWVGESKDRG